jgi:hypothetical protein
LESLSKPLGSEDTSAFEFVKEMLKGDPTYGINFDRVQWDSELEGYVIVEFLLCDERQFSHDITPYTSHPKRYFKKNAQKFISLSTLAERLGAKLYLVNYSKTGTAHQDKVLLMEVLGVDPSSPPYVRTRDTRHTRESFSTWFRQLNSRGSH